MIEADFPVRGTTPYSQSKPFDDAKLPRESPADYDERCWRQRLNLTSTGYVEIPALAFKNALSSAARYLGVKTKGKGTFTKHFESGIFIPSGIVLPVKGEDVVGNRVFVPADGKRGGGSRVWKRFPVIEEGWSGTLHIVVLDEIITLPVLHEHLVAAGNFIGIGRWRPSNNGLYGRFTVGEGKIVTKLAA